MKLLFLFTLISLAFSLNPSALEIHIFKVGQADSQLLVFPSGFSILIDCGDSDPNASNTHHISSRIQAILGRKHVDIFVLTHYHVDHSGLIGQSGIWYLLEIEGFTVGKFIKRNVGSYNGALAKCSKKTMKWKYAGEMGKNMINVVCYAVSTKEPTKLSAIAENAHRCNNNQIVPPDAGASVTFLMRDALGVKSSGNKISKNTVGDSTPTAENDFSICMRIVYGQFVYATCGDMSGYKITGKKKFHNIESSVAPMMGEVDVLKINHHGSKTATNEKWCKTLKPTVSVLTCGGGGSLPNERPLKNLKAVNSLIYTTGGADCNQAAISKYNNIIQMNDDVVITVPTGGTTFTVSNSAGQNASPFAIKTAKKAPSACKCLEK